MDADTLGQRLVREAGILALPATMFTPEGDKAGRQQLRIAFANIDCATIAQMFDRLSAFEG
jgi:aspartate/methionine/tyrosine aminotransferase